MINVLKCKVLKYYRKKSYICITEWVFIIISPIYVHDILVPIAFFCVTCTVPYSALLYSDALGKNPVNLIFQQVLQWKYLTATFICFIALFIFLSLLIYQNAKIKAESQILATYDNIHGHTTNDHIQAVNHLLSSSSRANYLRAEIFQKTIPGSRVTLHFSRRSLWPALSQYFWKPSHEERCGVDLFTAPVLQQTASQHPPGNFPMSENTEENWSSLLIYPEDNDRTGVQGEGLNPRLASRNWGLPPCLRVR